MRTLLAYFITRRMWRLGKDWPASMRHMAALTDQQRDDVLLDILSLIGTALGIGCAIPPDVRLDWTRRAVARCNAVQQD